MSMNVLWDFPYPTKYYLTHPLKFFKHLRINIRDARMRMRKGYCLSDVWNMDLWFLDVFPPMLRDLAEKGQAYPGPETDFDTPEKWHDWLNSVADRLEECKEDNYEKKNEYYKDFYSSNFKDKELTKKYIQRDQELAEEAHQKLKDTMAEIAQNFYMLWD